MDFSSFLSKKIALEKKALGGLDAQFRFAPKLRLQYNDERIQARNPKKAAVLALFYPNEYKETCILLTERATYKGLHSAQISFPGGKIDVNDLNLQATALRETYEEVGVHQENITIIREITDVYIPPSNFLATPFIAYTQQKPIFKTNYEVAKTIEVSLKELLNEKNITSMNITTSYAENMDIPCFKFGNDIVWGATAMMLNEIKELFK